MDGFLDAADIDSLPPGRGRTVELRGKRFALFNVDGKFHAIDDACPHRGAPLGGGWCEGGEVFCPMHGWAFDIRSGECIAKGTSPLRRWDSKVEGGRLFARW